MCIHVVRETLIYDGYRHGNGHRWRLLGAAYADGSLDL